jgi:hypothetical protein
MRKFLIMFTVVGLFAAAPLTAQQLEVKPGPEHAFLKKAEGVWDATAKSMAGDSQGELHCKMALNGLWLLEHYKGEAGVKAFEGRGATSYDPAKKKFVNVWIDSMVPSPMLSEGTYDKEKKIMTLKGTMPMPDGKSMSPRSRSPTRTRTPRSSRSRGTWTGRNSRWSRSPTNAGRSEDTSG